MKGRFESISVIFNYLGYLFYLLGLFLLIPLIFALIYRDPQSSTLSFVYSSLLSFALGYVFQKVFKKGKISNLHATIICSLGWIFISLVGAIPFVLAIKSSFVDAYFETMSGFTTTGITMYSGLDNMPKSILIWRSIMQWIGGLGILTFFLAIISQTSGGNNLFGAESHKIDVKRPVPGMKHTVKILWTIYSIFTAFIFINLLLAGSTFFDALCHSLTTISTGGFSPFDASIAHYNNIGHAHYIWIEYIIILGMFLGGTNFLIHYRVFFMKQFNAIYDSIEMKYWFGFIFFFTLIIFLEVFIKSANIPFEIDNFQFWVKVEELFRNTLFQVVSVMTTTGFGTVDINTNYFGHAAKLLFLVMMFIGGSVGSTSGGFKIMRIAILVKLAKREIFKLWAPKKAITYVLMDKEVLEKDEIFRVAGLFFAWLVLIVIGGTITALFSDHTGFSSVSGMFSSLGNIGPCYISVEEISQLHPIIKITYTFGMLAGRLEILPVLLLFCPNAWK